MFFEIIGHITKPSYYNKQYSIIIQIKFWSYYRIFLNKSLFLFKLFEIISLILREEQSMFAIEKFAIVLMATVLSDKVRCWPHIDFESRWSLNISDQLTVIDNNRCKFLLLATCWTCIRIEALKSWLLENTFILLRLDADCN